MRESVFHVCVVFKQGIYRHQCGGVFDVLADGLGQAIELCQAEEDDYHQFHLVTFELGRKYATGDEYACSPKRPTDEPAPCLIVARQGSELRIFRDEYEYGKFETGQTIDEARRDRSVSDGFCLGAAIEKWEADKAAVQKEVG